jgi:3-dehydroquinate dehydratase
MHHRPNHLRLGQILIHLDVITHQEVIEARKVQMIKQTSKRLGEIMINAGYITHEDLSRALSLQKDIVMNVYR